MSLDDFEPLKKHERNYDHVDVLATISAGYKNAEGRPVVSRDGTIYISDAEGRAPGLAKALAANGGKHLTIAIPNNDWRQFIHQNYRKESKGDLLAHGDKAGITELIKVDGGKSPARRVFHPAGSEGFDKLRAECSVNTSITFILADYAQDGTIVYPMPDSVGAYRLRTTSEHTAENLISVLKRISQFTNGQIAGVPLTISLSYPQKTTPTGTKAKAPVFVFAVKMPAGMALTSKTLPKLTAGASEAIGLSLPALPPGETIEDVIAEVSATQLNAMATGVNPDKVRATWFAIVDGTEYASDAARAAWLDEYTGGATSSLREFLETATPESADEMLEALRQRVDGVSTAEPDPVTVEAEAMATKPEIAELWAAIQACAPSAAKETLRDCLDGYGCAGTADLTSAQARQAAAHYRAHAPKEAA